MSFPITNDQMNSEIHKMLGLKPGSKLSRSVLTSMSVGQLQFILNYFLSQVCLFYHSAQLNFS
jgi:hypothetical protein